MRESLGLLISQQEENRDNRSEPGTTLSICVSLALHPSNRTSSQGSKLKNRSAEDISDPNHSPGQAQVTAFWCPAPCPTMVLGTQLAVWLRWLSLCKSHSHQKEGALLWTAMSLFAKIHYNPFVVGDPLNK